MENITLNKIPFITGWKIELSKLPQYTHFTGDFIEKSDWKLLKIIYESAFLETRPEIKTSVKNLMEKTLRSSGDIKVSHKQRYNCGRFYADNSISLIPLSRYVKHTVLKYLGWLDIDMIKGHPSIAIEMGKQIGLSFQAFENYVNNFDNIVKELSEFYSADISNPLSKDNVKWVFNSMIYGGGFNNWIKGVKTGDESYEPRSIKNETIIHPIITAFKAECEMIANRIYRENPALIKKVAENKDDVYKKKSSVCSYWFQIIENHIVHIVAEDLINRKILTPKTFGLEFDGLNIPPTIDFDKNKVIDEINSLIVLTTGLNIKFKFKDYEETNILHELIEIRKNGVDDDTDLDDDTDTETVNDDVENNFKKLCVDFEKTHCKIINKSFFIKHDDNSFKIMTEKQLITSYKHITYKNADGKQMNFIDHWIKNNNKIRCYDDVGIYPNKSKCPKNHFNLWEDFAMENVVKYTPCQDKVDFILNHIKIMCNNDIQIYDFLICWLAHIIQKPDEKSIVPTLISNEGAGKSSLIVLMTMLFGVGKIFETAKPSRDVWGNFNGKMKDCFIVNLNELSLKELKDFEGEFKKLVTESSLTINEKGISQYDIKSFHRFFITSNSQMPIKPGRRAFIIRCSDELISNTEYFDKYYKYMDDVNVVKSVYEYLKNYKQCGVDMSCFRDMMNNPPRTDYELEIRESSMSVPEQFIKSFIYDHISENIVEKSGNEMFELFMMWKHANNIKYDTTPQKLGVSISYLSLSGIIKGQHTRYGATKCYNISLLKQHYKIGNESICRNLLNEISYDEE